MTSDSRRQEAAEQVRMAKTMERKGHEKSAAATWDRVRRQYVRAGLDPDWFDGVERLGLVAREPSLMDMFGDIATGTIELTYDKDAAGLTVDPDTLVDVRR